MREATKIEIAAFGENNQNNGAIKILILNVCLVHSTAQARLGQVSIKLDLSVCATT